DGADWRALAWWIHDHLPYSQLQFFPKLAAFNIGWHERPRRRVDSFIAPKGCLTRPGMANHDGSHADLYPGFPRLRTGEKGYGELNASNPTRGATGGERRSRGRHSRMRDAGATAST